MINIRCILTFFKAISSLLINLDKSKMVIGSCNEKRLGSSKVKFFLFPKVSCIASWHEVHHQQNGEIVVLLEDVLTV